MFPSLESPLQRLLYSLKTAQLEDFCAATDTLTWLSLFSRNPCSPSLFCALSQVDRRSAVSTLT
jgi:hypothetical protein